MERKKWIYVRSESISVFFFLWKLNSSTYGINKMRSINVMCKCQGCGQLLFEVLRGVIGQFHWNKRQKTLSRVSINLYPSSLKWLTQVSWLKFFAMYNQFGDHAIASQKSSQKYCANFVHPRPQILRSRVVLCKIFTVWSVLGKCW